MHNTSIMSWLWLCRTTSVTLPVPVSCNTVQEDKTNLSDLFKAEASFKDIIYQEPVMLEHRVEELERRLTDLENMNKNTLKNLESLKTLETLEVIEDTKVTKVNEDENNIVVEVKEVKEVKDPVLANFFKTVHAEIDYIEKNLETPLPAKLIEQLRILSSSASIPIPNSPKLPELR